MHYLDIHEDDKLDEAQFAVWVKQASQLQLGQGLTKVTFASSSTASSPATLDPPPPMARKNANTSRHQDLARYV